MSNTETLVAPHETALDTPLGTPLASLPPPRSRATRLKAYVGTPGNTLITLVSALVMGFIAWKAVEWLFLEATFEGTSETCKTTDGACWPFITGKLRFILFGFYPFEEQWRPMAATLILLIAGGLSMIPRLWSRALLIGWIFVILPLLALLMGGGLFGLAPVPTSKWGGLPLSFMLSVIGLAAAFPLGVLLALARASDLPAIRVLAVTFIEVIRGVPLISILFMATVMLPLFLPDGWTVDKLLRAQIAIILFASAYIAEIVRGGLQDVPKGQFEAGASLGLHYWQVMRLLVLPQALTKVIPPMVSLFIGFFQDTTLVNIVGLLDFLDTIRSAMRDPDWQGIAVLEGYLFAAAVYFLFSALLGQYSRYLERYFRTSHA